MNPLSTDSNGSEMIFVELFQALSGSEDRLSILADFIQRFPDREAEIRELAGFNSALDDSRAIAPPPPLPARLGEFRIGRLIKVGGMGEIYEAFHERLDRRVALKIVRRGWTTSYARERFAREQFVLAKLHHSNIVPIQTGGEDGPIQYFTMPFIQGSALNHVVDAVANISSSNSSLRTPSVQEIVSKVLQKTDASNPAPSVLPNDVSNIRDSNKRKDSCKLTKLSQSYFHSVAQTMCDVAEAIEYAHRAGVLHRDLKPANVMIESSGHCWVIDFGLAARLVSVESESTVSRIGETLFGSLTNEPGGGTYNYMAPERWLGKGSDERSDVFSLGAMLYELLALRQAYSGTISAEIKSKILQGWRVPIKKFVKNLPDDLAAIADKAMNVEPKLRYQSAAEFAEDLRRWLRFEPILATRIMPWKRVWLWTRRKPTVAAAILFSLFAATFATAAVIDSYANQTLIAKADASAAEAQAEVAETQNRISTIRLQRDGLQQGLLGEHSIGWSEDSWDRVRKLVREDSGGELKSLAAASRLGIDSQLAHQWEYSTSHLAFNPAGNKLLMVKHVAVDPTTMNGLAVLRHAQIWDSVTHRMQQLPEAAHDAVGPVVFRSDDEPLQLVWNKKEPSTISLWNIAKQVAAGRMECPTPMAEAPLSWSIIPSGLVGSALVKQEDKLVVYVWETATGKTLTKLDTNASVIELSPDGELIATACPNGVIEIWSVASGEKVARFSDSHANILCFAWTKDRTRPLDDTESGWLLAAGAFGGDLTIWDVDRKTARSHCIGSCFEIFSLAFSPDGMTLASAGRGQPVLWDVATGELLLRLEHDNTLTSIIYSPKGESLAVGSIPAWGSLGCTSVYEIQESRGQQVIRGLRSRVTRVRISANNRIIAALSDNWQLAVWDLKAHRLLHVFQVPIGVYAESAGLAIDAAERRIAVVSGSQAKLWDIETGKLIHSVKLQRGFLDSVVFQDENTLISARQESIDPDFPPEGKNTRPDVTPRVCRVRNLLGAEPEEPFLTISDFRRTAASINLTPSGSQLLIEGYFETGDVPEKRLVRMYNLPDGSQVWEKESNAEGAKAHRIHAMDPTGQVVAMAHPSMNGLCQLINLATGREIRDLRNNTKGLGPKAAMNVCVRIDPEVPGKVFHAIVQGEEETEVLRIGLIKPPSDGVAISSDERYCVYGCSDGSVVVIDLWSVQRKLTEVGLN